MMTQGERNAKGLRLIIAQYDKVRADRRAGELPFSKREWDAIESSWGGAADLASEALEARGRLNPRYDGT